MLHGETAAVGADTQLMRQNTLHVSTAMRALYPACTVLIPCVFTSHLFSCQDLITHHLQLCSCNSMTEQHDTW